MFQVCLLPGAVLPSAHCSMLNVKITKVGQKVKNFVIAATTSVTTTWLEGWTWLFIPFLLQASLCRLHAGHCDNNDKTFVLK